VKSSVPSGLTNVVDPENTGLVAPNSFTNVADLDCASLSTSSL
jgi:hypothetical protein